jgi:hypothetical protein
MRTARLGLRPAAAVVAALPLRTWMPGALEPSGGAPQSGRGRLLCRAAVEYAAPIGVKSPASGHG